jgi:hypothetical protein
MRSLAAAISPGYFGFTDWAFAAEAASEIAVQVPIATRKNNALIIGSSHSFILADALNLFGLLGRLGPDQAIETSSDRSSHQFAASARGSPQLAVGTRLRPGSQKESTASLKLASPIEDRSATAFLCVLVVC